ncbi:hypothetical protein HWV62_6783 [Athelia sp. TMB]|nr:hypothetical protein HWV62_6783 [Athelia sp. TMB]
MSHPDGIAHTARTHTSDAYVLPSDDAERRSTGSCGARSAGASSSPPPPNAHLATASATQLPAAWSGAFALAHQRFLAGAWAAALGELHRVLRPGGWACLCEMGCAAARMAFAPGPRAARMFALVDAVFARAAFELAGWLAEAGFVRVEQELVRIPLCGEAGREMREDVYTVHAALKTPALRAGGFGLVGSEAEYDALVRDTRDELEHTPDAALQIFMVWGQKPV